MKLVQGEFPVGMLPITNYELFLFDRSCRDVILKGRNVKVLGILQANVSCLVLQILNNIFDVSVRQIHFEIRFSKVVFPSPSRYQERSHIYGGSKKIKST